MLDCRRPDDVEGKRERKGLSLITSPWSRSTVISGEKDEKTHGLRNHSVSDTRKKPVLTDSGIGQKDDGRGREL